MPLKRHFILIYSLGDTKSAENPGAVNGEALILQKNKTKLLCSFNNNREYYRKMQNGKHPLVKF